MSAHDVTFRSFCCASMRAHRALHILAQYPHASDDPEIAIKRIGAFSEIEAAAQSLGQIAQFSTEAKIAAAAAARIVQMLAVLRPMAEEAKAALC